MRIASWASALYIAACGHTQNVSKDQIEVTWQGKRHPVSVTRDATLDTHADVEVIATLSAALVVIDNYTSRSGGLALCQAGTERFLRVIALNEDPARETYSLKLESCRDNIELASPGLDWNAANEALHIEWLQRPNLPLQLTLDITGKGQATPR